MLQVKIEVHVCAYGYAHVQVVYFFAYKFILYMSFEKYVTFFLSTYFNDQDAE